MATFSIPAYLFWVCFILLLSVIFLGLAQGEGDSQSRCPKEFDCANLKNVSFPFTNTSQSDCGLYSLDCGASSFARIKFGKKQYDIESIWGETMRISLPQSYFLKQNCSTFYRSFSFPSSALISFLPRMRNLYRCNRSSDVVTLQKIAHYFTGLASYNDCKNFIVYYQEDYNGTAPGGNLPAECSVIQLPFRRKSTASDFFGKLSSSIRVQWEVSEICADCHYNGGRCLTDHNNNTLCSGGIGTCIYMKLLWPKIGFTGQRLVSFLILKACVHHFHCLFLLSL